MRKEGKSVKKEIEKIYQDAVEALLPEDFLKDGGLKLRVDINKPKSIEIDIIDKNNRILFYGLSVCSPQDDWDEVTGLFLAIARLRINVNAYLKKQKKKSKIWVPKLGDVYYIPYMDVLTRKIYATKIVWTDGDLDHIRLSLGNVYRTEREARKAIRRNILNGRHIVKEARKNV